MKKTLLTLGVVSASIALVACSTTTTNLYPKGHNRYTVVSLSRSASDAASASLKKATKTCQDSNRSLVVLSNKSIYQGAGKALGQVSQAVSDAAFMADGLSFGSTKSNSDYKNTLTFSCR